MINLKYTLFLFFAAFFIFSGISFSQAQEPGAEPEAEAGLEIPVSFSYSSLYWWRGFVINEGAGVFWPGVGAVFGGSGIELSAAAGLSENWFTKEDSASEDAAKSYSEIDYGISYSKEIEKLSVGFGLMYIQYPFYDEVDTEAADPSFIEGSVSLGIDTILSPAIELYYDYYIEARKGCDGKDVPASEDYYAKLSVSHDIISTEDGFTLSAGAWIGYYNDPYWEASGWSDAVISLGFSKDIDNLSASSSLYYGRSIGKDFRDANGGIKNHFWCDFGLTYVL